MGVPQLSRALSLSVRSARTGSAAYLPLVHIYEMILEDESILRAVLLIMSQKLELRRRVRQNGIASSLCGIRKQAASGGC
eukprot:scaffold229702_cov22-Tisochrysis_lutea.AAC.1